MTNECWQFFASCAAAVLFLGAVLTTVDMRPHHPAAHTHLASR